MQRNLDDFHGLGFGTLPLRGDAERGPSNLKIGKARTKGEYVWRAHGNRWTKANECDSDFLEENHSGSDCNPSSPPEDPRVLFSEAIFTFRKRGGETLPGNPTTKGAFKVVLATAPIGAGAIRGAGLSSCRCAADWIHSNAR
jgi:hypothetical protein